MLGRLLFLATTVHVTGTTVAVDSIVGLSLMMTMIPMVIVSHRLWSAMSVVERQGNANVNHEHPDTVCLEL